jgi:hypothetical protein
VATGVLKLGILALLVFIARAAADQDSPQNLTESNRGDVAATVPIASRSTDRSSEYRAKINLGNVKTGATVNSSFLLGNETEVLLHFDRVKTTCSCVQAKIPASRLNAGEATKNVSELTVKIPQVRAKKFTVAELVLSSKDAPDQELRLMVNANIERSFHVPHQKISTMLDQSESFSHLIPFELF